MVLMDWLEGLRHWLSLGCQLLFFQYVLVGIYTIEVSIMDGIKLLVSLFQYYAKVKSRLWCTGGMLILNKERENKNLYHF